MMRPPSARALPALLLVPLLLACASSPRAGPDASGDTIWSDGSAGIRPLLEAWEARDHARLHARAQSVVERCGTAPLGQQALLLLAAGELDPRNARGRPAVALQATELVLGGVEPGSWSGALAVSLHLIARRLGAERDGLYAAEQRELLARATAGKERESGEPSAACRAAPWPRGGAGVDPPSMRGRSYPAHVIELQRRVAELEEELERLRRLTQEP